MNAKKTEKTEKITIELGQMVEITLESMLSSTGYGWYLAEFSSGLILIDMNTCPTSTHRIAPVKHHFKFQGRSIGKSSATFVKTAIWKDETPVEEITYEFEIKKQEKKENDDLSLSGFVEKPKADVNTDPAMLYNVKDPNDACARLYYGVLCKQVTDHVRTYYGVLPKSAVEPTPLYAVYPPECRPYYAACPPTERITPYYAICSPTESYASSHKLVLKYNIPPAIEYGFPSMAKYNYPPLQRYNFPEKDDCCRPPDC